MKNDFIYKLFGCSVLINPLISYGLSPFIPVANTLCMLTALTIAVFSYFLFIKPTLDDVKRQGSSIDEKELSSIFEKLEEQESVISEYETMLSEQIVQLPCNCGKVLFEGILIPNAENLCKCSACDSSYKVMISYDSLLLTEEMNSGEIFDNMIKVRENSNNKTLP